MFVTFPAYMNEGCGDNAEFEVDVELSDEQVAELQEAMDNDEELEDHPELYHIVYEAAVMQATEELKENGPGIEDYLDDDQDIDDWRADQVFTIGFDFPEEI